MEFQTVERVVKKISYTTVKSSFLYHYNPDRYAVMIEVSTSTGEHIVQGFDFNLCPVFGFKCDVLRHIFKDHQTRMILPKEFELNIDKGGNGRQQG